MAVIRVIEYSLMYSETMSASWRPACGLAGPLFSTTTSIGVFGLNPGPTPVDVFEGTVTSILTCSGPGSWNGALTAAATSRVTDWSGVRPASEISRDVRWSAHARAAGGTGWPSRNTVSQLGRIGRLRLSTR